MSKVCYFASDAPLKAIHPFIWEIKPYSEAPKTDKKYFAEVAELDENDLSLIIGYIQDHMKKKKDIKVRDLEFYYLWLGNDEEDIIEKTCSLEEFTEGSLKQILLDDDNDYKIIITR